MVRRQIRVTGTVQGVGFRPFVHRVATARGLTGTVRNDAAGVLIDVQGPPDRLDELERALRCEAPPLARVTAVRTTPLPADPRWSGFAIVASDAVGEAAAAVAPDAATCAACLHELFDPADRRYRYPFINCTDCGPRYTIVRSVPYDRATTTMASFVMCPPCRREYEDAASRRFHAEPNACPDCGPTLHLGGAAGAAALAAAIAIVRDGGIVAVKGLGGYHLAADATNADAVATLRRRKRRDDKPFAVMVADLAMARTVCALDGPAAAALTAAERPIVLTPARPASPLAPGVAPGLAEVGVMLPYTPLHHLLLADLARPLVMTSGNRSDEPIAHEDGDARDRLGGLADGLLTHDRPIHIRCDDSVVRAGRRTAVLRRSRGLAPAPLPLPVPTARHLLAVGAQLKNTVAVAKDGYVIASHHIGDLEHLAAHRSFVQALTHLPALFGVRPEVVVHDLHPEYLSTKLALDLDVASFGVQHHHAHVASCLVEHGRTDPVVALAFDGTGYGTDGTLWGGEVLVADLVGAERVEHLPAVVMPGGVAAIREPWRMAVAWGLLDDPLIASLPGPTTTSMGRLFDAVAALLLTGRRPVTYEAQAAIALEVAARPVESRRTPRYEASLSEPRGLLDAVADDVARGRDRAEVAAGFHLAIATAAAQAAAYHAGRRGIDTVVLTGGVFQNALLAEATGAAVRAHGLRVLGHERIPANDGGISIGQAAVAAASMSR